MGCSIDWTSVAFLCCGSSRTVITRDWGLSRVPFDSLSKIRKVSGILVEEDAVERAEAECLADGEARARRRERDAARRAKEDFELQARMAEEIARLFPGCPAQRAQAIARHAAARGSGGLAAPAAGRALESGPIELAVAASVRHRDTSYDELLMSGLERADARERVGEEVTRVLEGWRRA